MPNALLLDDDRSVRKAITPFIEDFGFHVFAASTIEDANAIIKSKPLDLALLDIELPDGTGLDLLPTLNNLPSIDVIVISGRGTADLAIHAFRSGVLDFLTKPVDPDVLRAVLKKARRTAVLSEAVRDLRDELQSLGRFGPIIGQSPPMQKLFNYIKKLAPTDGSIFIIGETGTGKELVAQTIHDLSHRSSKPFIPVNCGALSENLIESELFGHEKGAFTGARNLHKGVFERSDGGTLFLDEITELPIQLQANFLRVLETGEFTRLGGSKLRKADVRVLAATNRDPEEAVKEGLLREDLMYRLSELPIEVPPLRERDEDALLIAEYFVKELNSKHGKKKVMSAGLCQYTKKHTWPGNVRELRNTIRRLYLLSEGDEIHEGDQQDQSFSDLSNPSPSSNKNDLSAASHDLSDRNDLAIHVGQSIAEAEKALILKTLEQFPDKKESAKILGISLKTLYSRLKQYKS